MSRHHSDRDQVMAAPVADAAEAIGAAAGAAPDDVDAQLDIVGQRIEKLLRASAEEKKLETFSSGFQTQPERHGNDAAASVEVEEEIVESLSDDDDWLPSPVRPLRVRARIEPHIVEASLGGPPSSFINVASGIDSVLSAPRSHDLGTETGRQSVALESTSRFVDARARFDELFQGE